MFNNIIYNIKYFFKVKLPDYWDRFKYFIHHGNTIYVFAFFFIAFSIPIVIINSIWAYRDLKQQDQNHKNGNNIKVETVYNNHILDKQVLKSGPAVYLREQLLCKTNQEVINKFNNNPIWHGRYQEVVQHAMALGDNINDFRNYLNPIINQINNGLTIKQSKIQHNFTVSPDNYQLSTNDKNDGVMVINWNPNSNNAQQTANQINNIVKNAKNYKVIVYNTSTQDGQNAFALPFWMFVQNVGNGQFVNGFSKNNAWPGVIYGFDNGLLTYHAKNLNNVPQTMPTESISN